jgi:hypothetical protein
LFELVRYRRSHSELKQSDLDLRFGQHSDVHHEGQRRADCQRAELEETQGYIQGDNATA